MADIFEQMKRGCQLLMVLETLGEAGVAFSLSQKDDRINTWVFETADGVCRAEGHDPAEVMQHALGLLADCKGRHR